MGKPAPAPVEKDRKNLGPTGPAERPKDSHKDEREQHPHPGNIPDGDADVVGPTPTDDPRGKAEDMENTIDKKRANTPPD